MINLIGICFYFPVLNLPVSLVSNQDLGLLNIAVQLVLCIMIFVKIFKRRYFLSKHHIQCTFFVFALSAYGATIGWSNVKHATIFLGIKFLLLPLLFSSLHVLDFSDCKKILYFGFIAQIANAVAVIVEVVLGQEKLLQLGFDYGTNIRDFSGTTRFPGLTLANYELGIFSAGVFALAYLILRDKNNEFKFSQNFLSLVLGSSITCLIGSSSRSGMIFVLIFFVIFSLSVKKNFAGITIIVLILISAFIMASMRSWVFVDTSSTSLRIELWKILFARVNFWYGAGLGSAGSASNSSYAEVGSRVFTDNQLIAFIYQCGLAGLILFFLIFFSLAKASVLKTFPLVISLLITSIFLEIWDYTLFMSMIFFVIFRFNLGYGWNPKLQVLPIK